MPDGPLHFRLDESGALWVSPSVEIIQHEWTENDSIRSVRFEPNSRLKMIRDWAFRGCRNLASISIPASVEVIDRFSFFECRSLTKVTFARDSRLRYIDGFGKCTSLSRIEIPASTEKISSLAFSECRSLTEVIFSADSRLREVNGFRRCKSLSRIEIPVSTETIGPSAVSECSGLTAVLFSADSCLRYIDGFGKCTSLSRIEIPASTQKISPLAFSGCTGLTEVIFSADSRLTQLYGFGKCASLKRLEIPASVEKICFSPKYHHADLLGREYGYLGDVSRRELIFRSGTRLQPHAKMERFRGFVVFEDENDLKRRRRQVHLGTWVFRG
jgi:hypothetical protein